MSCLWLFNYQTFCNHTTNIFLASKFMAHCLPIMKWAFGNIFNKDCAWSFNVWIAWSCRRMFPEALEDTTRECRERRRCLIGNKYDCCIQLHIFYFNAKDFSLLLIINMFIHFTVSFSNISFSIIWRFWTFIWALI